MPEETIFVGNELYVHYSLYKPATIKIQELTATITELQMTQIPVEYPHLPFCNGDRKFPAGVKGHSCCCLNYNRLSEQEVVSKVLDAVTVLYAQSKQEKMLTYEFVQAIREHLKENKSLSGGE